MKQQVFVKVGAIPIGKVIGLLCCFMLSLSCFSQSESTQPKTFIFSKYQLPAQSELGITTSFYSAPLPSSPYKIHYKIKTLSFPADTRSAQSSSLASAVINGIIETATKNLFKEDCAEKNRVFVPLKPTNALKY